MNGWYDPNDDDAPKPAFFGLGRDAPATRFETKPTRRERAFWWVMDLVARVGAWWRR